MEEYLTDYVGLCVLGLVFSVGGGSSQRKQKASLRAKCSATVCNKMIGDFEIYRGPFRYEIDFNQ